MEVKDVLSTARSQRYDERSQRSASVDGSDQKTVPQPPLSDYTSLRAEQSQREEPLRGDSQQCRSVPDCYAPTSFDGQNPDPEMWLAHYERYVDFRQMDDAAKAAGFPLFLRGSAIDWFETLGEDTKRDASKLIEEFRGYFCCSALDHVFDKESVFTRVQRPGEKAREFIANMQKLARRVPKLQEEVLLWLVLRGLRPHIKAYILQQTNLKSINDVAEAAKIAETAGISAGDLDEAGVTALMEEVRASRAEVQQMASKLARMSVGAVGSWSPTPSRRTAGRRVDVANTSYPHQNVRQPYRPTSSRRPSSAGQRGNCNRCGRNHGGVCRATNMTCFYCGQRGHLRVRCRLAMRSMGNP